MKSLTSLKGDQMPGTMNEGQKVANYLHTVRAVVKHSLQVSVLSR